LPIEGSCCSLVVLVEAVVVVVVVTAFKMLDLFCCFVFYEDVIYFIWCASFLL